MGLQTILHTAFRNCSVAMVPDPTQAKQEEAQKGSSASRTHAADYNLPINNNSIFVFGCSNSEII